MFSKFIKVVGELVDDTGPPISQTRVEVIDIIKKYIRKHKLILSNVDVLLGSDGQLGTFDVYGENILIHANDLSNEIAKITVYVKLYTNVKNMDFTIVVDGDRIVNLYGMRKSYIEVIDPVSVSNILLYPPELELIDICRRLYSPNHYDEWKDLEKKRESLLFLMRDRTFKLGGKCSNKNIKNRIDKSNIINWLKSRDDYVLIGEVALDYINGRDKNFQRIQIIVGESMNVFINELRNLILQSYGVYPLKKEYHVGISTDSRLEKNVISVVICDEKKRKFKTHIMDIYNAASYSLIPYSKYNGMHIGYPNVLISFLLIDLWLVRTLNHSGNFTDKSLKDYVRYVFKHISFIEKISHSKYNNEYYIGVFSDLMRYKRKQGTDNIYYPYIPEKYRFNKGCYRVLTAHKK